MAHSLGHDIVVAVAEWISGIFGEDDPGERCRSQYMYVTITPRTWLRASHARLVPTKLIGHATLRVPTL